MELLHSCENGHFGVKRAMDDNIVAELYRTKLRVSSLKG